MVYMKLKKLRKQCGLTQLEVADYMNMSQNTYSRIETGFSKLRADLIPKLCVLFNISPDDLFDEKINKQNKNP